MWDEQRIADERLGGLLGVARGSSEPPRFIRVAYTPEQPVEIDGRVPHVVLVGKGITFDSGGLSLKSADGMETMKTDMSGAAAVLAAMDAFAELGVRVRVTALTPVTENMPGGRATKPGDVLTARNGKTIEVLNTDAEGRLVLADALSLAAEMEPDAIVDLATLTGAAVVALGKSIAGLFGNDDDLQRAAAQRLGAGRRADCGRCRCPTSTGRHIDSEIADMKNIGKAGQAGAISAALLLREFVGEVPWAHLDIAGPARSDEDAAVPHQGRHRVRRADPGGAADLAGAGRIPGVVRGLRLRSGGWARLRRRLVRQRSVVLSHGPYRGLERDGRMEPAGSQPELDLVLPTTFLGQPERKVS